MQIQLDINAIPQYLVPFTELRRNPNGVLRKVGETGGIIVTKDGKPVAQISPILDDSSVNLAKDLAKIKKLAGKLDLGKISADKLNKLIDTEYDEMLPRQ